MYQPLEKGCCVYFILTLAGLGAVQSESFTGVQDNDDTSLPSLGKRAWSMLRLGRGLHMLRLGKRDSSLETLGSGSDSMLRSSRSQSNSDLTHPDWYAVLASILDQPRDETRRLPPLPRYGRDDSMATRELLDAIASADDGGFLDLYPTSSRRPYFRPAPRGGRYKRSVPQQPATYSGLGDYLPSDRQLYSQPFNRAVALPRIGRYLDLETRLQTKAVPRPRIGRDQIPSEQSSDDSESPKQ